MRTPHRGRRSRRQRRLIQVVLGGPVLQWILKDQGITGGRSTARPLMLWLPGQHQVSSRWGSAGLARQWNGCRNAWMPPWLQTCQVMDCWSSCGCYVEWSQMFKFVPCVTCHQLSINLKNIWKLWDWLSPWLEQTSTEWTWKHNVVFVASFQIK